MANGPDYMAVPAGRYKDFAETIDALGFEADTPSIRETTHEGRRLVVAHDPVMAEAARRRRRAKLDAQGAGNSIRRCGRASDRGAYARFQKAINHESPIPAMKRWQKSRPYLFMREVWNRL